MTNLELSPVTPLTRELRLATTMTGGVSLAIWMGGVAREINLLSQASRWRRVGGPFPAKNPLRGESSAALKLYGQLIDLLDMVVEVDILSGTSAGGINAALLASSRVTGVDLGGLRELWMDLGAMEDLLRDPKDTTAPSLLYGDMRMFAELKKQIPLLPAGPFPRGDEDPPSTTLYVTTTLLDGETSRFTDSFGTVVQDVDRRGLFTFNEQQLAKDETTAALALAARSSASFPGAFEPSFIPFTKGTSKTKEAPARPAMAGYMDTTRPHWVADGGLLDNRPIDVLVERAFDRRARRPVRRVLLFVVPSSGPAPDLVEAAPEDQVDEPLGLLDGLLKDLVAMTSQSIAADLRAIRAHQDLMEIRTDTRLRLLELAAGRRKGARLLTPQLLADYRRREVAHQSRGLVRALMRQLSTWPPAGPGESGIPDLWQQDMVVGGGVESICRRQVSDAIHTAWWSGQPDGSLPTSPDQLAVFGRAAYDLAKASALSVVRAVYQLAKSPEDRQALTELLKNLHGAADQPDRPDLDSLVRQVCTDPTVREGTLNAAAKTLGERYLQHTSVPGSDWLALGDVFAAAEVINLMQTLLRQAAALPPYPRPGSEQDRDRQAAGDLKTYLDYLNPVDGAEAVARRLFDLAAAQRAMLPVDADPEQSLELVQVSADTRSLLAPSRSTAQQKLTGMQFHHFGAFYKRSWRSNDWLWGRLDGAGWLVHLLLEPARVRTVVEQRAAGRATGETGAAWFLRQLHDLGAPDIPSEGFRVAPAGVPAPEATIDRARLLEELNFVDDPSVELPRSMPLTAMWLALAWQRLVVAEELPVLASAVGTGARGEEADWSPSKSRAWAAKVLQDGADLPALLDECPIPSETLASDKGSKLQVRTVAKAAATVANATTSVRQIPGVVTPVLSTLRTITLGAYRVVSGTKGVASRIITAGLALLVLGVAFAIQSTTLFGVTGLIMALVGGYLVVFGTWQKSTRLLFAGISFTLVAGIASLTLPVEREWLFGTSANDSGRVGEHVYWLGTEWWHPLVAIASIGGIIVLVGVAKPRRKSRSRSRRV